MNRIHRLAVTSAVALALSAPAFAQTAAPTPTPAPDQAPMSSEASPTAPTMSTTATGGVLIEQEASQTLASDLIGTKVIDAEGATVGEISDLILDDQNALEGVVLSVGGFLGLGAKKVGVPWDSLSVMTQDGSPVATIGASKQELADMPEFKTLLEVRAERERAAPPPTGGGTRLQ